MWRFKWRSHYVVMFKVVLLRTYCGTYLVLQSIFNMLDLLV